MKPKWYGRWRMAAVSIDVLFVGGMLVAWTAARFGIEALGPAFVPAPGRDFGRAPLAFALPVWFATFAALRLYSPLRCQNALEEGRRLIMAGFGAALALIMLGFVVKENPARSWLFGGMVLGTLAAAIGRRTLRAVVSRRRALGRWSTRTVVVGRRQGEVVLRALLRDNEAGILPSASCGFVTADLPSYDIAEISRAVEETSSGQVLVVGEGLERSEIAAAVQVADDLPVNVIVLPGLDYILLSSLQLVTVGHEPGLAMEARALHVWQRAAKRAIDIVVSAFLLLCTAPLLAAIAVVVRLTSSGPAVFRHKREGLRGSVFEALKFRTMREGTEHADDPDHGAFYAKEGADPRITPVGRWLRRTSLDELPQLWNILRGDMSLVGPRPLALPEATRLGLNRRLIVRPGLTGLWQVSGRSAVSAEERIRLDLVYVQNWSLLLDLAILLRTAPAVITGRGAY